LEFQNSLFDISNVQISHDSTFPSLAVPVLSSSSHYSSTSTFENMADDCNDIPGLSQTTKDMIDINHLFNTFTQQLSIHMNQLQDQLKENENRTQRENMKFKQEIRDEFEALRSFVTSPSSSVPPSSGVLLLDIRPSSSGVPSGFTIFPSVEASSPDLSNPSLTVSTSMNFQDVQTKMMLMLTESSSKLNTVLVDNKSQDMKSDWPKFSGGAKKFRTWYLSIMALISIPPWNELYDVGSNDIVSSTTNTSLNGKLYAKVISVLQGQALQDVLSRSHLRANGVLLLQELVQTYKPTNVPEVLAAKAGEFWSKTKRLANETVDTYYNRFHELLDELDQADDKISTKSAMRHFIFTLGSEFETIQNNHRIGNLPEEWKMTHWPTLLILCCNYYHSINPKGITTQDRDNSNEAYTKRMAQQKKVKEWFLNPVKY